MTKLTTFAAVTAGLAGLGAACLAYGVAVEPKAFRLRQVRVPVLPAGHRPIRVLHLSDLHLLASQSAKIGWVSRLADLRPDFVVNTGDNLADGAALPSLVDALRPLSGLPGVFVFGSNDYTGPRPVNPLAYLTSHEHQPSRQTLPTTALSLVLEQLGWVNIEQARHRFRLGDSAVEVRGCSDAHIDLDDYPSVMGPPAEPTDLILGVTHAPYRRVLDQMTADGAALMLAGHTHGGQVCLPGGHALTTNCDLPPSRAKGLSRHHYGPDQAFLHVSAGLGASPYAPYRFCCPPEASLLTLTGPDRA